MCASSVAVLLNNFAYGSNDAFDICFGHFRINRQRDNLVVDGTCVREVLRFIAELVAVIGMKVQRNEMNRCPDSFFSQCFNEIVAIDSKTLQGQLNYIKMP